MHVQNSGGAVLLVRSEVGELLTRVEGSKLLRQERPLKYGSLATVMNDVVHPTVVGQRRMTV
jgi:hypothetical protein